MLAVLSNINTDYIHRILSKKYDVVPTVGYGNIWGQLLNQQSILNNSNPDYVVLIVDIEQLLDGIFDLQKAIEMVDSWFVNFDAAVITDREYMVSDVSFRLETIEDNDSIFCEKVEYYWLDQLMDRVEKHSNIHLLKLQRIINEIGKRNFYSSKLWYMGKIPYSNEGSDRIAKEIISILELIERTNKKVLVVDLDNTLWGGILGEKGIEGIVLSDDRMGAIYKAVQQEILRMKQNGVMLAICSKNNESDVQKVWDNHPYMILKQEDFVSIKINWRDKTDNIRDMARELNLGLDAFVFIDDMPAERENITLRLPEVTVPGFPDNIEHYPEFINDIYNTYFKKMRSTDEDSVKTQQYLDNAKRKEAEKGLSYEEFLMSLNLNVRRVELNESRIERVVQLIGKTNQFNLTAKRYSRQTIDRMLADNYKIYAYNVCDKFGDYGLVAVAIVDINRQFLDSFLMSCRVMGKQVENYIINDIENDLLKQGIDVLYTEYIKTPKNKPVEKFFDGLGYEITESDRETTRYMINLKMRPNRNYYVENDQEG